MGGTAPESRALDRKDPAQRLVGKGTSWGQRQVRGPGLRCGQRAVSVPGFSFVYFPFRYQSKKDGRMEKGWPAREG